jgi:hypothetical protein
LVDGTTRTRIIDWVRTRSPENLESSSDPRRSTVNAPAVVAVGTALALGLGLKRPCVAEGEGISTDCPDALKAIIAAGRKYARLPEAAAISTASAEMTSERAGFRRLREALARRPGIPPSTAGIVPSRGYTFVSELLREV